MVYLMQSLLTKMGRILIFQAPSPEFLILFSSQDLQLTHLIYLYYQQIYKMSFYYFLQPTANAVASFQPIFYMPAQLQQPTPNFLIMTASNPSQVEQKQNLILQSNVATRQSLQQENEDKPKTLKKRKVVKKEKDENFGWRNQNKDRNIMSNILKAFIIYLLEQEQTKKIIQDLYKKLDLQSGVSDFFAFVQLNFPLTKSYISPKLVRTFLNDPSHPESLLMVFKLALMRFLRVDCSLILLKSTKIKRRSKLEQMKKSRELITALFSK